MENGKIEMSGKIEDVIFKYSSFAIQNISSFTIIEKESNGFYIHSISISNNGINGNFNIDQDLIFDIKTSANRDYETININIFFKTTDDSISFCYLFEP